MVYPYGSFPFQLFERLANIPTQEAPLLALHLPKSHTEAITHVPQIITYAVKEKGMEYKGEQREALVEPWCKHWSCCGW